MRRFAKIAAACALLLALAPAPPARAQFPFFFDNQPRAAPPPHREIRRKPTKQREKPARENRRPAAPKVEPQKIVEEGPPPPYEPQLLRLSEIMGALSVLDPLCEGGAEKDGGAWRQSMEKLMDAQEPGPRLRERLAGAYNRGLNGYTYFHRHCTPASGLARGRLLEEGGRLAREITATYREK